MARRIGLWICLWLIVSLAPIRAGQNSGDLLNDNEIRRLAAERIKALGGEQNGVGIVVGTISSEGRKIISAGERSLDDPHPLDGDTVFEIGSVTKVFTALLLAEMAEKNEVGLNDPVAKYLPAGFKVPEGNGKTISLLDLATHTSGFPFMPNESTISNESAAAKYSTADLRRFVASSELRGVGEKWEYSNIGYWLLSEALAARAGLDYESLVRKRVITPLALTNTAFALSREMKANFAAGHNAVLQPSSPISTLPIYSIMPAAGGLYSTANDLLKLLAVAMDYEHSPLDGATGEGIFAVAREADSLTLRSPAEWGLPKFRLHPENRQHFFAGELPMRLAFQFENDGSVKKMLVYPPRGQKPISAVRLDSSR